MGMSYFADVKTITFSDFLVAQSLMKESSQFASLL